MTANALTPGGRAWTKRFCSGRPLGPQPNAIEGRSADKALTAEVAETSPATESSTICSPATLINTSLVCAGIVVVTEQNVGDPMLSSAASLAGICVVLWLSEVIPLYVTTFILWIGMVAVLGRLDPVTFSWSRVMAPVTSPVMVLFFGGFVLSIAGARYGIESWIATRMIRTAGGSKRLLLLSVMAVTAVLFMWMLNTAAAAMMLVALRPLFASDPRDRSFRIALLLGLAFAANFGGIGTPIGTGPNLIAIGALQSRHSITFVEWMAFGVPVTVVMLVLTYVLLVKLYTVSGTIGRFTWQARPLQPGAGWVIALFFATVLAWLLEPVHHVPSALIAVAMAAVLFGTRLLGAADLRLVRWDTLLLIAGGITLGQLFDSSGLARTIAVSVGWSSLHPTAVLFGLILACAVISAVSSNTAAAALVIQIAMGITSSTSTPILVALGASMGIPFAISTPPNAMVYGEGGIRPRDLLITGTVLMIVGCLLITLIGPSVLQWLGLF
jgi:sodium-dependent dicarboxylate transporter 2/3/5